MGISLVFCFKTLQTPIGASSERISFCRYDLRTQQTMLQELRNEQTLLQELLRLAEKQKKHMFEKLKLKEHTNCAVPLRRTFPIQSNEIENVIGENQLRKACPRR